MFTDYVLLPEPTLKAILRGYNLSISHSEIDVRKSFLITVSRSVENRDFMAYTHIASSMMTYGWMQRFVYSCVNELEKFQYAKAVKNVVLKMSFDGRVMDETLHSFERNPYTQLKFFTESITRFND
jgi:hypothetical protein